MNFEVKLQLKKKKNHPTLKIKTENIYSKENKKFCNLIKRYLFHPTLLYTSA